MAKVTISPDTEIARSLGITTETEMIDWQSKDGTLITAAKAIQESMAGLSPAERRKTLEDVDRQLREQTGKGRAELEILDMQKQALGEEIKRLDPTALARHIPYPEIAGKYLPPQIGLEDPAAKYVAKNLAAVREQATKMWAKRKPEDAATFSNQWYRLGFPTFEVTGGLAAALCMTECRGLVGRDFRVPFAALAVQMPSPSPLLLPSLGDVRFMLLDGRDDVMVYAGDSACSGPLPAIGDNERIDDWLRVLKMPATHDGWSQIARFIVNLCVYINSLHAPVAEAEQRKPGGGKSEKREQSTPQRWVIGREIKLSAGMMQAARTVSGGTARQRAAYRMHVRFMVRGHWRNQAFGKKHAERRLRWIEPFWKGPEMAEGLARLYSVSGWPRAAPSKTDPAR